MTVRNVNRSARKLALCLALLSTACTYTLIEKPGAHDLADGENLIQTGHSKEAAVKLNRAFRDAQDKDIRSRALYELAHLYMRGDGVSRDIPRGIDYLSQASALDDQNATFELAEDYRLGTNVDANPQKAADLYLKIAPHFPAAGLALADLEKTQNVKGQGLASSASLVSASLPDLEWQAAKGNPGAMVLLAHAYRDGTGIPKDEGKAEEWYREAIAAGDSTAAVELADLWLAGGKRVHLGPDAAKLLAQAAKAGNVSAMNDLAHLEEDGIDGPPDLAAARGWYQKAAEHGNPNAMATLGHIYLTGNSGVPANPSLGVEWLNKAIAAGSFGAYTDLANAYMTGTGVPKDPQHGVDLLNKAIAAGSFGAYVDLGNAYRDGTGVAQDAQKAIGYYHLALKNGIVAANLEIGRMYLNGIGMRPDAATAFSYFQLAAKDDVIGAARELGDLYFAGNGTARDSSASAHWYEIAVRQGDRRAMVSLGDQYSTGDGVPKDDVKAVSLYREAAALDLVEGIFDLARAYHTGIGIGKDEAQAKQWVEHVLVVDPTRTLAVGNAYAKGEVVDVDAPRAFALYEKAHEDDPSNQEAVMKVSECYERGFGTPVNYTKAFDGYMSVAKGGNVMAMTKVAKAYETGVGAPASPEKSFEWRQKAAGSGDTQSMVKLAQTYTFGGNGVDADMKKSVAMYEKAAAAGDPQAQYQLGVSYARGVGVPKDLGKARMWLMKAKANGYPIAGAVLDSLIKSSNAAPVPTSTSTPAPMKSND